MDNFAASLKEVKIVTEYVHPPIPARCFDWAATTDSYEPGHPIGNGETEAEAIADLKEQLSND